MKRSLRLLFLLCVEILLLWNLAGEFVTTVPPLAFRATHAGRSIHTAGTMLSVVLAGGGVAVVVAAPSLTLHLGMGILCLVAGALAVGQVVLNAIAARGSGLLQVTMDAVNVGLLGAVILVAFGAAFLRAGRGRADDCG